MIYFDKETKIVGGLVGDALNDVGNSITDGIVNGFTQIVEYIVVIAYWVCKIGILMCLLVFICSQDKKAVTLGFKLGFIYLIIAIVGGVL